MNSTGQHILDRRHFLRRCGMGLGALGLGEVLSAEGAASQPHFPGTAKRVIHFFLNGGPSHVDTFDPKPALQTHAGRELPRGKFRTERKTGAAFPSPFEFKAHGQSGIEVSSIFPGVAQHVDEIAVIRSMKAKLPNHEPSLMLMNCGDAILSRPSVGSWVTYGLGAESSSLPAFVVMNDYRGGPLGGPNDWSAGFMPAAYQGTLFRAVGDPIVDLQPPEGISEAQQRARLDTLAKLNEIDIAQNPGNSELSARISSYELAYRMQGCAPEAVDTAAESDATKKLYGLDESITEPFGRQCLMARRLVERGVRFVQLFHGGLGVQNTDTWDAHSNLKENHSQHAAETDLPIAGLLTDLKSRGMLDSTLIVWHAEFGRMPISQRGVGRDHNPGAMSGWMAGAGIQGGQVIGASDEFGYKAAEQRISAHDFHATMLHLLGMDHTQLTYRYNGRDMRLTDVHGVPIPQIIA